MKRIDPDTLYSREDLKELFADFGLNADTVTGRIRPRKIFRGFFLGSDLLEALRNAPALNDREEPGAVSKKTSFPNPRKNQRLRLNPNGGGLITVEVDAPKGQESPKRRDNEKITSSGNSVRNHPGNPAPLERG
jgi:hypothetical protein